MQVLPSIPEPSEIRRELELILASSVFRGSKRCQDFLRYVSTKSLEGEAGTLKERTLAIEVFGRDTATDLGADSIVRVGAREVRKRLAQYYVTDGAHDPVRIDLPPGSYVPSFHYYGEDAEAAQRSEGPLAAVLPPKPPQAGSPSHFLLPAAMVFAALAVLAIGLWSFARRGTPFDSFWAPVFKTKSPVVLVLPHPIVYHPSSRATDLDLALHGDSRLPVQRPLNLPPQLLNGSDFVPVLDQYVGFGDAVAALRFTTLLDRHARYARFRLASKVEFSDLRDSTPILIGAFTNRWTVELTKNMRFRFHSNGGNYGILDTSGHHIWSLAKKADGRSAEDYVLICRLPHSETGNFIMIGAGVNMTGTEEAGRILADPESLSPILRQLPKGWETRNLELVLHVEVVGDTPVLPQLVAVQSWKG